MVNVKDFVTSRLPTHGLTEGMEADRSEGCSTMAQLKFTWGHAAEDGSTDDVGKMVLVPPKVEKGELSMGPMVMFGWKSKDYSALAEESASLVGKSTGMAETTLGGFATQTTGVSHMKVEAPP